jgi:hypothetical protein
VIHSVTTPTSTNTSPSLFSSSLSCHSWSSCVHVLA